MLFGAKNINPQQFGSKVNNGLQFGSKNTIRKVSNTLNKINSVLGPAITAAKYVAPLLL